MGQLNKLFIFFNVVFLKVIFKDNHRGHTEMGAKRPTT